MDPDDGVISISTLWSSNVVLLTVVPTNFEQWMIIDVTVSVLLEFDVAVSVISLASMLMIELISESLTPDAKDIWPNDWTRGTVENGVYHKKYNIMKFSKQNIEKKMGCKLNPYEEAVLAIAIGDLNNKCLKSLLSAQELEEIFQDLWNGKSNANNECLTFERLVTTM